LSELVAAVDETNNLEYWAFIVGVPKSIAVNEERLPTNFSQMTTMGTINDKRNLLNEFSWDGDVLVYCVKYGIPELLKKIRNRQESQALRRQWKQIHVRISYEIGRNIREMYEDFVVKNGIVITDLQFQADNDMVRNYLRTGGYKWINPAGAHRIADCIVHANGKHIKLDNRIHEYGDVFKRGFQRRVINQIIR
jgi:hypothetical protein